jgi:hypothetical protein
MDWNSVSWGEELERNYARLDRKNALAYRTVLKIQHREFTLPDVIRKRRAAIQKRRQRLTLHMFWISMGTVIVGLSMAFSEGILEHILVLGSTVPAFAQEITDFVKNL